MVRAGSCHLPQQGGRRLDSVVSHIDQERRSDRIDRQVSPATVFAVLLYCAGVIGGVAGYAYLALTNSSSPRHDVVVQWGLAGQAAPGLRLSRRRGLHDLPLCHGSFSSIAGRCRASDGRRTAPSPLVGSPVGCRAHRHPRLLLDRRCGAARRGPGDWARSPSSTTITRTFIWASWSKSVSVRVPYLEAQTQYGVGNQLLLYFVTDLVNFSNHGFYAGALLIDVVCVIGFFVVLQQLPGAWLGDRRPDRVGALAEPRRRPGRPRLGGPDALARRPGSGAAAGPALLGDWPGRRRWLAPVLAGAIWGTGGFLSQENVSGGFLVFVLSLALYGPVAACTARYRPFAALFVASGRRSSWCWSQVRRPL